MDVLTHTGTWLTLVGCFLLTCGVAAADEVGVAPVDVLVEQELLTHPAFTVENSAPAIKGWRVDGAIGGTVKALAGSTGEGILLGTERGSLPDGTEFWQGAVITENAIEVLPGRRYRFEVEARGIGPLSIGVIEYGWRYSSHRLSMREVTHPLTADPQTYTFEYTPSTDSVAYVRPMVKITGWWHRAELRRASFVSQVQPSAITAAAGHFIAAAGTTMPLTIQSDHYPIKLLVYGPTGVSGPGGDTGGSLAFVDVFKFAQEVQGAAGQLIEMALPIPADAIEGSYRVVAVVPGVGSAAETRFAVASSAGAGQMLAAVEAVDLPPGSTLIFLGDSLTANFPGRNYVSLLERAFAWRFGDAVRVINAGIGGNNIKQIAARLDRDVLAHTPTHVFLFEGANDTKRNYRHGTLRDWAVPPDEYERTYRDVLARLAAANVKTIIMTHAPGAPESLAFFRRQKEVFGESGNLFCIPEEVERCVTIQKVLAGEFKLDVIDTHALLKQTMAAQRAAGSTDYIHVDDGVHLSEYGNREVAHLILEYVRTK